MRTQTKAAGQSRLARLGLRPRGLSRDEAAAYIGVSVGMFNTLVDLGRMPQPKDVKATSVAVGRLVWDIEQLDSFFDRLPDTSGAAGDAADEWSAMV